MVTGACAIAFVEAPAAGKTIALAACVPVTPANRPKLMAQAASIDTFIYYLLDLLTLSGTDT